MIITAAESRLVLGLASSITDADRGLIELLLPQVNAAIRKIIHYDPEYKQHVEFYPQNEGQLRDVSGQWDSNGTVAYFQRNDHASLLQLAHLPVRSIEQLKADYNGGFGQKADTFGDDTVLAAGTDYWMDQLQAGMNMTGHVFSNTAWPVEPGTVKVTYYAGYTQLELAGRSDQDETDPETEADGTGFDAGGIKAAALKTMVHAFKHFKVMASGMNVNGTISGVLTGEHMGDYSYTKDLGLLKHGLDVAVPPSAVEDLEPFIHYGVMLL